MAVKDDLTDRVTDLKKKLSDDSLVPFEAKSVFKVLFPDASDEDIAKMEEDARTKVVHVYKNGQLME